MELRTLRAFVEVVRQGGFSQAAKVVFATQSTVSKAVKQLEDELGLVLLDRNGHRNDLTAAGEVVYRRALRMLAERDDLVRELDELRGLKRGVLRLGLPPIGSATLFAPLFAAYRNRYPGIEIQLSEHGSARLEELLHSGELDLAGLLAPVAEEFAWQDVQRGPIVPLIAADHPLAGKPQVSLADLAAVPFLLFETGFAINQIILAACEHSRFTPKVAARSSQIAFVTELVAAGLGVSFLPRILTQQLHPKIRILELKDSRLEWHLVLAWRRGGYLSQAAKAWLELAMAPGPENKPPGLQERVRTSASGRR